MNDDRHLDGPDPVPSDGFTRSSGVSRRGVLRSTAWAVPAIAAAVAAPQAAASGDDGIEWYDGTIVWDRYDAEDDLPPPPSPAMWWVRTQPIGGPVGMLVRLLGFGPSGLPYHVPGPFLVDWKFSDDPDLLRLDWLDPNPPVEGNVTNLVNWAGISDWQVLDDATRVTFTVHADVNSSTGISEDGRRSRSTRASHLPVRSGWPAILPVASSTAMPPSSS